MKHLAVWSALVLLAWLSGVAEFVRVVLLSVWPVAAAAAAMAAAASGLAISVWVIGVSLRTLRSSDESPIEIIPRSATFAFDGGAGGEVDYSSEWEREVLVFAFIGNTAGFSLRSMLAYCSRADWERLAGLLTGAGILESGKGGTRWAAGWTYGRLKAEVKHGVLALPYPAGPAPAVHWVRAQPAHTANTAHTARTVQTHEISRGVWVGS